MDDEKIIDKKGWRANFLAMSYVFMTTLFALIDPSLSVIESTYSTLVHDAIYAHLDTMIDAIQIGALPEIYELGEYRPHIKVWRFDFYKFFSLPCLPM